MPICRSMGRDRSSAWETLRLSFWVKFVCYTNELNGWINIAIKSVNNISIQLKRWNNIMHEIWGHRLYCCMKKRSKVPTTIKKNVVRNSSSIETTSEAHFLSVRLFSLSIYVSLCLTHIHNIRVCIAALRFV